VDLLGSVTLDSTVARPYYQFTILYVITMKKIPTTAV